MTSEQVQFQEFFAAHYPRLRRLGYWLTGSPMEAEDLAAVRVRVLGRCGWEPAETDAVDAGPEFPARFFLVAPQRKGYPDVVLAFDADGRQVGRQAILPPGPGCPNP